MGHVVRKEGDWQFDAVPRALNSVIKLDLPSGTLTDQWGELQHLYFSDLGFFCFPYRNLGWI